MFNRNFNENQSRKRIKIKLLTIFLKKQFFSNLKNFLTPVRHPIQKKYNLKTTYFMHIFLDFRYRQKTFFCFSKFRISYCCCAAECKDVDGYKIWINTVSRIFLRYASFFTPKFFLQIYLFLVFAFIFDKITDFMFESGVFLSFTKVDRLDRAKRG